MTLVLRTLIVVVALALAPAPAGAQSNPLQSVVHVRASVPPDTRTARTLGTNRLGSGVVIDGDGLVLTIGYAILEASEAQIVTSDGRTVPADVVGYDHNTGFGLLRAAVDLGVEPIELGSSAGLNPDDPVLVVSNRDGALAPQGVRVADIRPFAGYWEYLLDEAIFTTPPHPFFGGAALIGPGGRLLGIGSLQVRDASGAGLGRPGNMFIPIDALKPILGDLIASGRGSGPPRPWLGVYLRELRGRLVVTRVVPDGPAADAGINRGDLVLGVAGEPVDRLADFYRRVWDQGDAGVDVPLAILRRGQLGETVVHSGDRYEWLQLDTTY